MKTKLLTLFTVLFVAVSCSDDSTAPLLPERIALQQGDVRDLAILLETTRQEFRDSIWTNKTKTTIAGLASFNIVSITNDGAHALIRLNDVSVTTKGNATSANVQLSQKGAAVFLPADGTSGTILQTDSVGMNEYNYFMQVVRTLKDFHVAIPQQQVALGEQWTMTRVDTAIALGATRESSYNFEYTYQEYKDTLKHKAIVIPFSLERVVDHVLERTENAPVIEISHDKVDHNGEMLIDSKTGKTLAMSSDLEMHTTVSQQTETGLVPLLQTRMNSAVRVVTVAYADGLQLPTSTDTVDKKNTHTDTLEVVQ